MIYDVTIFQDGSYQSGSGYSSNSPSAVSHATDSLGGVYCAFTEFYDSYDFAKGAYRDQQGFVWVSNCAPNYSHIDEVSVCSHSGQGYSYGTFCWRRSGNIQCQRMDRYGGQTWAEDEVLVSNNAASGRPILAAERDFATVIVWSSARNLDTDLFAAFVEKHGYLGNPSPILTSIADHPQDQGGMVLLTWDPSYLDAFPETTISSYSVWRRLTQEEWRANIGAGKNEDPSLESKDIDCIHAMLREGWSFVGEFPAAYFEEYSYEAPTYGDSTETEIIFTEYQVIAHTEDPWAFWKSNSLAGYSVDNLAPAPPTGFIVHYDQDISLLSWDECEEEDFNYFRIYRGESQEFEPTEQNLVHTTSGTEWEDPGHGIYYKISTVDTAGNEGDAVPPEVVTGTPGTATGKLTLFACVPNPFNPSTTIHFSLAEAVQVTLAIYDLAGRRICDLHRGELAQGDHEIQWHGVDDKGNPVPSGVYLYRLEAGGQVLTRKMTLLK